MPSYKFEPTYGIAGRYRDTRTGRFISQAVVRKELDTYLDASDNAMKALAGQLRGRNLSLVDWEYAMRREIKRVHINAVVLERGGYANMRPQDWGRVGAAVRKQYEYLTNFGLQIMDGYQKLDGSLDYRMEMYSRAGRRTFYDSKHANMSAEVTHVRSIRHARDSCRECIDFDGRWYKVGDPAYKVPGNRICLVNCRCSEEFGAMVDGELVGTGAT